MRLRMVKRFSLVSSAAIAAVLNGCHPQPVKPNKPVGSNPGMSRPTTGQLPSTMATTMGSESATTIPATMAATVPAGNPTTLAAQPAIVPPVTQPVVVPATGIAVTQPATTLPASTQAMTTQPATTQAVATTGPVFHDAPPETDSKIIETDAILAERFAGIAELEFNNKVTNAKAWPLIWKHQAAIFSACQKLNPREPRYARLKADAMAQDHDVEGEIQALGEAILAQRGVGQPDEFTWNRDLDLRLQSIETADKKLAYLSDVIGAPNSLIPADVRAHAAFRKAQTLLDRGEEESANKAIAEALVLCPNSVECLKLRYDLLPATTPKYERALQLMDLLRANPLQSQYSSQLAELIAESGLAQESLTWFNLAVGTLYREGYAGAQLRLDQAAALFISDDKENAQRANKILLKIDPANTQAHLLDVILAISREDKDGYTQAIQEAGNALTNRVIDAINAAQPAGATKATTRPINDVTPLPMPDVASAAALIKQSGTPQVREQFIEAVADLALLEGYFAKQSDVATKLIDALEVVAPKDSPEIARLRGWNLYQSGKIADARVAFTSVVTQDPLAELGLIQIMMTDPNQRTQAESMGRKLLQEHPSGMLGAMLWQPLHSDRVKLVPTTQADGLKTSLAAFPPELLQLAAPDEAKNFYLLHVQPYPVATRVGEPLMVQLTISNLSGHDLTIGRDGLLKPELLFHITPETATKPSFDAFDTIAGPTVLPKGEHITQTIRLDQTQMLAYLNTQPGIAFETSGTLTTNQVVRQLGGYQVQFFEKFYRIATPLSSENIQSALQDAENGRPDQKIEALTLLDMFVHQIRSIQKPTEAMGQQIGLMMETIHRARTDALPAVAAWASKCEAELVGQDKVDFILRDMAESPDWRQRQLALLMLGIATPQTRNDLLTKLLADPQSNVVADAKSVQGIMNLPPSTMPTTMPVAPPSH